MGLKSRAATIFWYLKNPTYYKQFLRLFYLKFLPDSNENTRKESTEWCEKQCIDTFELTKQLAIEKAIPIEEKYPEIFKNATKKVANLPVKMGGSGAISVLYYLAEYIQAERVIETGVAHGWSSLALLLSLSKREGSKLISTDMPYAKMGNEHYVGCVVPENFKSQWHLIRKPDISALPEALKIMPEFDLCHYDSDKSYRGKMWALPKLWKNLRDGGILISDDIGDNLAFLHFSQKIKKEPYVVKFKNQFVGVIIK